MLLPARTSDFTGKGGDVRNDAQDNDDDELREKLEMVGSVCGKEQAGGKREATCGKLGSGLSRYLGGTSIRKGGWARRSRTSDPAQ